MMETSDAHLTGGLQQCLCSHDVGAEESGGVQHREAVVGFSREIHDDVDAILTQRLLGEWEIANVALDEPYSLVQILEIGAIARVGQQVVGDNLIGGMCEIPVPHKVGADESRGTCDE